MATKKFSRLSVMLEATDRMSRPLQQAAKGADTFRKNILKVEESVNHTDNSFKRASEETKILADNYKILAERLGQSSEQAKESSLIYKLMPDYMKKAADAAKQFSNNAKEAASSTRPWQTMDSLLSTIKSKIQAASLAFNIWKNNSAVIDKVKSGMDKLIGTFSKFNILKRNVQQADDSLGKMGNRRATFNQLADANAKLNKQLDNLNAKLNTANSRLGNMKSRLGNIDMVGKGFAAYYAGQAAYGTGKTAITDTVGQAMQQNYNANAVGILAGQKNGSKFYNQIADYASSTPYSTDEWMQNIRSAIGKSKSTSDLKTYETAMQQLAMWDPEQGLSGAGLAIRELNSGTTTSMVQRFELPRNAINSIKNIKDPIKQISELSKIIGKQTGYTVANVEKMKQLPLMQWQKFQNTVKFAMGQAGMGALKVLEPVFRKVNQEMSSPAAQKNIQAISKSLANITKGLISIGSHMNFSSGFSKMGGPISKLFSNIKTTVAQEWPTISKIFSSVAGIFTNLVTVVNKSWPVIDAVLKTGLKILSSVFSAIEKISKAFAKWSGTPELVVGVVTAILTFKSIMGIVSVILTVIKVVTSMKKALAEAAAVEWTLNAAFLANPIVAIIAGIVAAIAGLVAAFIWAYKHSTTFRNGMNALGKWLSGAFKGMVHIGAAAIKGIASAFKTVVSWVSTAWNKIASFFGWITKQKPTTTVTVKNKGYSSGNVKVYNPHKHKGGLSYVPYDGYDAVLHRGERVLTKDENRKKNNASSQPLITGNTFVVRKDTDIEQIAQKLFEKLNGAATGGVI